MENKSPEINELVKALSKAQSVITGAVKGEMNSYFKSKYADLSAVWDACRIPLSSNGLAIVQTMQDSSDKPALVTMLMHESGQWLSSTMPLPIQKPDPQTLGAVITYCRRYALQAMVGICPIDDDAESAMKDYRDTPKPATFEDLTKDLDQSDLQAWLTDIVKKAGKNPDGTHKYPVSYWKEKWIKQPADARENFLKWWESWKGNKKAVNM